ncbi:MAG: hypothetical protein ACYTFY_21515, partial [Planctomycetota bacterium]
MSLVIGIPTPFLFHVSAVNIWASQSPFHQTAAARGRLFLDEVDTRTHLASEIQRRYGRADSEAESIELLWRDMVLPLAHGNIAWQLDFGFSGTKKNITDPGWIPPSYHTTPRLLEEHKKINTLWSKSDKINLEQLDEVRIFTPLNHGVTNHCVSNVMSLLNMTADEWKRAGVPVAYYSLEDLLEGHISFGKLNIFSSCASLSKKNYDKLKQLLKDSGTTCLWMMGAGILEPGSGRSPSVEKLKGLTGIAQDLIYEDNIYRGTFFEGNDNPFIDSKVSDLFGQLERPVVSNFGEFSRAAPKKPETISLPYRIAVRDSAAQSIGRFIESGEICWALKK